MVMPAGWLNLLSLLERNYNNINIKRMDEQKLKIILEEQRKQYENYFGVVAERLESQNKLIAESVLGVQEQLVVLRNIVAKNSESMKNLHVMVAKNAENIEIIKSDVQFIKQGLKRKVDQDEFENLEKRVIFLEKKIS
ncbi:MAG: hypothetical protein KJI70_01515 [Patescibacteria group bacterium]|nr:hypothetical protein [Patescibacteria group bacterium]